MKIDEILKMQPNERVSALKKGRRSPAPDLAKITKEWDPSKHEIFNPADRPDKTVYYPIYDENGRETTGSRIEKVARIAVSLQQLIVKRAASFLFGNPVKIISSDEKSLITIAVNRILADAKQKGLNRRVARTLFSCTEVAEYWYPVEAREKFSSYGFETDTKIKVAIFSPLKGDKLFPFFDGNGDLIAFSREFVVTEDDKDVTYFETWTADEYTKYKQEGGKWVDAMESPIKIQLGKIPIVYASQEETEWKTVQGLIDRLEKLLSNFGDTNDYHASPKTVIKGQVKGYSKKGEAGAIIEIEGDGDVKVVAWEQAPESVRLEIDNLLRLIFSLTQTPDISFDAVKGLGSAASGQSLKMLFLDAHLKVMDKLEIFDDYLERRLNILKAFVVQLKKSLTAEAQTIELIAEVLPFMVDDQRDTVDNLVTAVSGGILSKKTAMSKNPYVEDPEQEFDQLQQEQDQESSSATALDALQNEL